MTGRRGPVFSKERFAPMGKSPNFFRDMKEQHHFKTFAYPEGVTETMEGRIKAEIKRMATNDAKRSKIKTRHLTGFVWRNGDHTRFAWGGHQAFANMAYMLILGSSYDENSVRRLRTEFGVIAVGGYDGNNLGFEGSYGPTPQQIRAMRNIVQDSGLEIDSIAVDVGSLDYSQDIKFRITL